MLARQAGGNAEAGEPDPATHHVDQDIGRIDVLMDKASLMHAADRICERDRDAKEFNGLQRSTEQAIERLAAGILEQQRRAAVLVGQRDWARRPGSVKLGRERVFVFQALERSA